MNRRAVKFAARVGMGILCFGALAVILGYAVMLLWNGVVSSVFDVRHLSYWQAVGMLALCRLLVGGLHPKRRYKGCGCRHREAAVDQFVAQGR